MDEVVGLPAVLLLSETKALNALDKKIIREAGIEHIITMFSGLEACKSLAQNHRITSTLIAVVNQKLSDMSGEQFCRLVRLHPLLINLPILLILSSSNESDQLLAEGCGANHIIVRPYSVDAMRANIFSLIKILKTAPEVSNQAPKTSIKDFDAAILKFQLTLNTDQHTPEDYFKVGMLCLEQKKYNSALHAFKSALASETLKGESELGIAYAWRGKGNNKDAEAWLMRSAETFMATGKWQNARTVYHRLQALNANVRNPFFIQARKQINQSAYELAALTLAESLETNLTEDQSEKLAVLCLTAKEPDLMLQHLQTAIKQHDHNNENIDEFLASLQIKFINKIQEQEERQREAAEKRQAELSERIFKSQQPEILADNQPEISTALPEQSTEIEFGKPLQQKQENTANALTAAHKQTFGQQKKVTKGIAVRDSPILVNENGLLTLPGDAENEHTTALEQLPAASGASFFGDLLRVAKLTWRLSRNKPH